MTRHRTYRPAHTRTPGPPPSKEPANWPRPHDHARQPPCPLFQQRGGGSSEDLPRHCAAAPANRLRLPRSFGTRPRHRHFATAFVSPAIGDLVPIRRTARGPAAIPPAWPSGEASSRAATPVPIVTLAAPTWTRAHLTSSNRIARVQVLAPAQERIPDQPVAAPLLPAWSGPGTDWLGPPPVDLLQQLRTSWSTAAAAWPDRSLVTVMTGSGRTSSSSLRARAQPRSTR